MNDDAPPPSGPTVGTRRFIAAGFAVVLGLLAALVLLGLVHMATLKKQTAALISENSIKTESVYVMSRVARERFASLGLMTMLDDPFERDEEFLRFIHQASTFIVARDRLHEVGMSPAEQAIWTRIRTHIRRDQRAYDVALDLALAGNGAAARAHLLHEVRPLDNTLFELFDELGTAHRNATRDALAETERAYHQAAATMIALAILAFAIGLTVAWIVTHRSHATEAALARQRQAALAAAKQLSWAASHDPLTGLANRREALRRLALLVQEVQAQRARHVLAYIDLDHFKAVNDRCGHAAGDELLRQLAGVLTRHVRNGDLLARLGGDEFLIVLTYCDMDKAHELTNALRHDVAHHPFEWEGRPFRIGASIGLAHLEPGMDAGTALKAADAACYRAKARGRNTVTSSATGLADSRPVADTQA